MNQNFDLCWEFTSSMEGPKSNDAGDPGGLTIWGVAQTFWPPERLQRIAGVSDIVLLTREKAGLCFKAEAWDVVHADSLPWPADLAISDSCFNNGDGAAVRNLQGIVGAKQDGVYGPKTGEAVKGWLAARANPGLELAKAFTERRMRNYIARVKYIERYDRTGAKFGMPADAARVFLGEYWMPRLMQLWMFVAGHPNGSGE